MELHFSALAGLNVFDCGLFQDQQLTLVTIV